jgi:hypothetical protein
MTNSTKNLEHACQARTLVRLHLQKAHATLILRDPAHERLFDLDGLELVGKPELQSQTRPAHDGCLSSFLESAPEPIRRRPRESNGVGIQLEG